MCRFTVYRTLHREECAAKALKHVISYSIKVVLEIVFSNDINFIVLLTIVLSRVL